MFGSLHRQQNEVHRKIGKFMLVFQDVERMLKFIVAVGSISAPLSRLDSIQKHRFEKLSEKTMGSVIDAFIKQFSQSKTDDQLELDVITEAQIKASVIINMDDASKASFFEGLERIRLIRNEIAHGLIQQIDLSTKDGCKKALVLLDARWGVTKPDIEQLHRVFHSCRESLLQSISVQPSENPR